MIKKILLINPPKISGRSREMATPPLGLAYLAAVLEKDYTIKILDAQIGETKTTIGNKKYYGLSPDEIRKEIKRFSPDIIGIGSMFTKDAATTYNTIKIAKEFQVPVITGGNHATAMPEKHLEFADYVILGEGEETTKELIDCLNKKKTIEKIDGLAYKKQGKIKLNPKTRFIKDLDTIPMPARHLLDMDYYIKNLKAHGVYKRRPFTSIITSRGCPANCIFCSIKTSYGAHWKGHSPKRVVDEIGFLIKTYKIKEIHFEDDNLTFDNKRMSEICREIKKRKLDITWTTPNGTAVYTLNKPLLKEMKQSGCFALSLAIEHGNQQFLSKTIQKPLSLSYAKEIIQECTKLGIRTTGFFILGTPGETKELMQDTINYAVESDLDQAMFFVMTPYPNTPLARLCIEKGYLPKDPNWETMDLENHFIQTESLTKEDITNYLKKAQGLFSSSRKSVLFPIRKFILSKSSYPVRDWLRKVRS